MINASQEFKQKIQEGAKFVNYADITLKDGTVLELEPSDFAVGGFSMVDELTDGKFGVGFVIGKTISLTIANHTNKFSTYDFYKSIIYMYVAVELEDGTVLKERKGKYYVINPTSPGKTINLSGIDSMYLLDKPYTANTVFPATLQTILSDCCVDCGVNIGFGQFDNYTFVVNQKPEDVTYRDVVGYVAQIAGYNARINVNDALELVWYDTTFMELDALNGGNLLSYDEADTYDGGSFSNYSDNVLYDGGNFTDPSPENITKINSLTVSTDNIIITGVKLEYEEVSILKGIDDYVINISNNPLVLGKENEIAEYLKNKLVGLKFRPLSCDITNNPLLEPFDSVYVYDRSGNYYYALINSVQYKIGGYTTIACKAEDPVRNETSYTSEAAKAVVQAKKNTEMQLTTYDKAVQNMNLLAANSMGLYRESEEQSDKSIIYFMSNRPITKNSAGKCVFEQNSIVYKMTADGFFVSTDGGKSFTTGFDAKGNAVVNVLSAIGITFDWAKGGTITLGGGNNIDGKIDVFDKNNNHLGSWDNLGFWTKSYDYHVPTTEECAKETHIGCGSLKREVEIKLVLAKGAESAVSNISNIITIQTTTTQTLLTRPPSTPDGYEDNYPYWNLSKIAGTSKMIFLDANLVDYSTGKGLIKRVECYYKSGGGKILNYYRDFSNAHPTEGVIANLREGIFENSTWKVEGSNIYHKNRLKNQLVTLGISNLSTHKVIATEEELFEYSELMIVSEHVSNAIIQSAITFHPMLIGTLISGGVIRSAASNYAEIIVNNGETSNDPRTISLKTSNTAYAAYLYGIV